ncbi:MAG: polyphosphate polymerase domain-containing protein [Chloroflexota bacterium]
MQDQGYTYLRSFRYERKFLVEDLMPFQVEALIRQHPQNFRAPYPPRHVNNLYLDTSDMINYYDNVHGAMQRRKVRVRWYGEPFGEIGRPMLEIKVKDGMVGTKHTYPLSAFRLEARFCDRIFQGLLSDSDLPPAVRHTLRGLNVVLFNRYHRHYYATHDGAFRLTLDNRMEFYKVNGLFENQFVHRQENFKDVIVELKYENEQEPQADRVAGFFPFRVTRNSKYVQGIERVYF